MKKKFTKYFPVKEIFLSLLKGNGYWIKGIEIGYLNSSPFEALTLAIIIHMTLSIINIPKIGNPIIMKHKGITRTI